MCESREHRYLARVVDRVKALGLFENEVVRGRLGALPDWLVRFQSAEGFAAFEAEHGVRIPAALKEFWSRPALVCAWTVAGVDALTEPPSVEEWDGARCLTFDVHWHSSTVGAVRLDGTDDPPVVVDDRPGEIRSRCLSEYFVAGFRSAEHKRGR